MTAHKNHEHFNTYTCYLHQPIYIPFGYSSSGMKPTSLQPSRPPAHNNGHGPKLTSVQILEKPDIPRFDPNVHAHNTLFLTTRDMEVSTFFFFFGSPAKGVGAHERLQLQGKKPAQIQRRPRQLGEKQGIQPTWLPLVLMEVSLEWVFFTGLSQVDISQNTLVASKL